MFHLTAAKNNLTLVPQSREPVTSGSVNVYHVRFEFSEEWEGLTRTAVFQAGGVSVPVPLDETSECVIPSEVLRIPGLRLEAGVYGTQGGTVVLPSIWASLGMILEGVPAPEAGPSPPAPGGDSGANANVFLQSITLTASGWGGDGLQSVAVMGVSADETKQIIQPMPKAADQQAYYTAGILCVGQDTDQLTFRARTVPAEDLTVYVAVTEAGYKGEKEA